MPALEPSDADTNLFSSLSPLQPVAEPAAPEMGPAPRTISRMADRNGVSSESLEQPIPATNKLQRLTDIRELFRGLAGGDATAALREAKQLTEENERETALLTLVTEWTRGELSPAGQRARYISAFGLEAGLGMELLKTPELAIVWANELTDGRGRSALLGQIAMATGGSDPGAALALSRKWRKTNAASSPVHFTRDGPRATRLRLCITWINWLTRRSGKLRSRRFERWRRWGSVRN